MYRPLAIAVFLAAVVFPPRLAGRSRAGSRPSVPFHSSIGPRIPAGHLAPRGFAVMRARPFGGRTVFVGTFPFRHHSHFRFFFGNPCFTNPFFDPFFCREFFFNRFPFAQPVFLPYPVYTAPNYPVSEQASSIVHQRSYLAGEVERLTDEVERLREGQERWKESVQFQTQARPSVAEKTPTTTLVCRSGHWSEVQNYAIVGQTLWEFTEHRARKIPVSDLDVAATKKMNAERGIEFRLP